MSRCEELYKFVTPLLYRNIPMKEPTPEQAEEMENQRDCYLCKRPLGVERDRDHCRMTGDILGVAHPECNRERRTSKYLPIVFQNMSGYVNKVGTQDLQTYWLPKIKTLSKT